LSWSLLKKSLALVIGHSLSNVEERLGVHTIRHAAKADKTKRLYEGCRVPDKSGSSEPLSRCIFDLTGKSKYRPCAPQSCSVIGRPECLILTIRSKSFCEISIMCGSAFHHGKMCRRFVETRRRKNMAGRALRTVSHFSGASFASDERSINS